MKFIKGQQEKQVKEIFQKLKDDVKLVFFTQELECQFCRETRQLLREITELSDGKITLDIYNFAIDKEKVQEYGVDKIPAIVVQGAKDYGIRFYGIPSGYEFTSLVSSIVAVSKNESGLSEETKSRLKELKEPIHIQTFVTVTCPYCPKAVELSHRLAIESDLIRADMVEAMEFPQLVQKYNVMSVPKTVVNDKLEFEGALPEKEYVDNILSVLNVKEQSEEKPT